ncbi:TetR/AcrR family transcriptional regulator [Mumia zhuanghuii]|uniref:TetR/AcrR family transcriptional regulator n=2 Tax=Mumia TaxID=1546255 RepID=A0ABW1QJR0_9ACTN|nr:MULTISPECIES: TetR/AcrR family transcriptional regulator [Mumia]KAA1424778.1 TetR/AcrR family transcriptional regulator [Mumia zhuanghuii]
MDTVDLSRTERKHRAIIDAATATFVAKGYAGTSMDEIARVAAVSKQTVYKHFADKERLFAEVVLSTTDRVDGIVSLVADISADADDLEPKLQVLAEQLLGAVVQPGTIALRRLVIANAEQFPDVSASWYEEGFERVLLTLADSFARLSDAGLLRMDDSAMAAQHFAALVLWIPVNRAMFHGAGGDPVDVAEQAAIAVRTFLAAYAAA